MKMLHCTQLELYIRSLNPTPRYTYHNVCNELGMKRFLELLEYKKSSRQIMCLKESFCPFTRDALNFWQPKIYAAPHHPAVFTVQVSVFPQQSSLCRCSVQYPASSFCSVSAHAHRKSEVSSNNAPTRNVYVTLEYLLLFAVDMQYS